MTVPSRAVTPAGQKTQPAIAQQHHQHPPTQVIIVKPTALRSQGARTTCPCCLRDVYTKTDKKPGTLAWISCCLLCVVGCFCGCCLIPLCIDTCKDTDHECPECGTDLGTYKAFF